MNAWCSVGPGDRNGSEGKELVGGGGNRTRPQRLLASAPDHGRGRSALWVFIDYGQVYGPKQTVPVVSVGNGPSEPSRNVYSAGTKNATMSSCA